MKKERLLCKKKQQSVNILGKSTLVEGLAYDFVNNNIDVTIYRLDLGMIIAGTKYRGDLEERLLKVIDKVKGERLYYDRFEKSTRSI